MAAKTASEQAADNRAAETSEEANILFPEYRLQLDGREVIVREFTFAQGLRLEVVAAPIIRALVAVADWAQVDHHAVMSLIADHSDAYFALVSESTGIPVEEIMQMTDRDGQEVAIAFWEVNSGFFISRVLRRLMQDQVNAQASAKFSQH